MSFLGNKPQEEALSILIHDTNQSLSSVHALHVSPLWEKLNQLIDEKRITVDEYKFMNDHIRSLESRSKTALSHIDKYYLKFKKDFQP